MANNTTWSFAGLSGRSSILSYSPEIPGVVFELIFGVVKPDGVYTVLNAVGTPTQAGYFSPIIRVGTNTCYKDVRVILNVAPAEVAPPPGKPCAVALANGTSRYGLNVGLSHTQASFAITHNKSLDITPSEYGTFSFSYVSGQEVPGLSLVAVPRTATHWSVDPASAYMPVTLDAATIAALKGKTFQAVWRVTFTSTSGCTASLDFPVDFIVHEITYRGSGGGGDGA